jgi:Peptidase inhibitor family I36
MVATRLLPSHLRRRSTLLAVLALAAALASVVPAAANPATDGGVTHPDNGGSMPDGGKTMLATYRGKAIDLKKGWGNAKACNVISRSEVRCYDTYQEADAAVGDDPSTAEAGVLSTPACASGWLCLYEHINGGGRRLIFNDDYWHGLRDYGFENKTSSYRNRQGCSDWGG